MSTTRYAPRSPADVIDLVARHPLALLLSAHAGRVLSTPLPMRVESVVDGHIVSFIGHMARANAQVAPLRAEAQASLLFFGAHGYVSPSWFDDRTQAPTWNYAYANFSVRIEFLDDGASLERVVRDLVDGMEHGRAHAWRVDDMGARYAQLATRIIAFRAHVTHLDSRFKLGQDERDDVYPQIVDGLRAEGGHDELIAMMQLFNAHRHTDAHS